MKQVIAMHGWGINSDIWHEWKKKFQDLEWKWTNAERGYSYSPEKEASWLKEEKLFSCKRRLFIGHSLGTHLINTEVLKYATDIVLLYSFSSFIPKEERSQSIQIALEAMYKHIGTSKEDSMHRNFLKKAGYRLNMENVNSLKLSDTGREKLKGDLQILINTKGLPKNTNKNARVLIINGGRDKIVCRESQEILSRDSRSYFQLEPKIWAVPEASHTLFSEKIFNGINNWIRI